MAISKRLKRIITFLLCLFPLLCLLVTPAMAVTTVSGTTITQDTVWTAAASPYYVTGNITVAAGKTLTIEAGVLVKFAQGTVIYVSGLLSAVGNTGTGQIYFTDYRDDTAGGDTNGDSGASSPAAGSWSGIYIYDGGSATIDHCVVRYAYGGSGYAGVSKRGTGTLTLTNSTISNGSAYGVWITGSTATHIISNNTIQFNGSYGILLQSTGAGVTVSANTVTSNGSSGIYVENSSPTITGNTSTNNANYGIYITGAAIPATVTGNTLTGNTVGPVGMAADSSGTVIAGDNTFTGPLYIDGGSLTKNTTWCNNRVYYIRGNITVNSGATLTIPAGRVVKFTQNTGIFVSGALSATGSTGTGQIYFTDYRDDTAGGDTNGDGNASSPGGGWWYGIHLYDGGSATLDHCVIRYAYAGSNYYAPVYKTGMGTLRLTNSTITNGNAFGVWITGSSAAHTISDNTIQYNGSHGILLQNAGAGVTVSGNTVTSNGESGIYVENSSPSITGNTSISNASYGIYITGAAIPATITGNTLTGNTVGPVGMAADSSGTVIAGDNTFTAPLYIDGGSLTKNTTWGNNRVYYIRGSITVNSGATLTIPAGRVIKFAQGTVLYVSGALSAAGSTGTEQIYFTDYRDDTAGGDTNGDGNASSPGGGWWYGIHLYDGGSATLDHCVIRYAYAGSNYYAPVYKTGMGTLRLTNSTITNGNAFGVWITGSSAAHTISDNTIQYNGSHGILLQNAGAGVTVSGNTVTSNGESGIYVENSSPSITGNTSISNASYGIYITGAAIPATITGNTLTGNTVGPVGMAADSSGTVIAGDNTFTAPLYIDGGSLTKNTTWGNNRVYYIRGSITVNSGATLTIPAGRVIKFAQGTVLYVSGALSAAGSTGTEQIYFTDYRDDTAGGDTNGDGNASSPGGGWWYGIHLYDGGSATLDHCVIRYAYAGSNYYAPVYKTGMGTLRLTNSTITNGNAFGVWITGSSAAHTISDNTIQYNGSHGILLQNAGAGVTVSGNTVTSNGESGIYVENSSPSITGNTSISNASYGIYITGAAIPATITGNTLTGNTVGPVGMAADSSGTVIAGDNTFTAPLYIDGGSLTKNTTWGNNRVYYIRGSITVNSGATLTIPAGRVIKFAQGTVLYVSGALSAAGSTGTEQIYFTDYRDDTAGDDTNGDGFASSPAAGWWYGIYIYDGGSATIDHCVVRYAYGGSGYAGVSKRGTGILSLTNSTIEYGSAYGVWITGSSAAHIISNNNIRNNGSYGLVLENAGAGILIDSNIITGHSDTGIYLSGAEATPNLFKNHIFANANGIKVIDPANPVIGSADNGNEIYGNTNYGLYTNRTSSAVTALYNWWGSSTGPYNAATNASGTGNKVSDNVAYTNYLSTGATLPVVADITTINGATYTQNTTWTLANSPYYISGNIMVNFGATLTIETGVVVKFAQDTGIFVSGTLSAIGASGTGQIYFTDYRDDTAGGDTNGDGNASLPGAAWWHGIHINDGGSATLDYCVVRYAKGGYYDYPFYNYFAGVYKTGTGVLNLTNSTISNGSAYGVWITGSTATHTISNNTIQYNGSYGILLQNAGTGVTMNANTVTANGNSGLYSENSSPAITGNTASGNINYGIYVTGAAVPSSVAGNTLTGNTIGPVGMAADSSATVVADSNTFTGPLYIDGGSLTKETTWSNSRIYYIRGNITVNPGVTLTIPAGRVIKFAQDTGIFVSGTLSAVGTSGTGQIYFTDYRDDTAGGDTNGDGNASLPGAAWWHGIHINDGGSATLDYCVVRYAKGGYYDYPFYNYFAGVYKTGTGVLNLTNSTISNGSAYGVWITGSTATHTISNNTIQYNGSYGILLQNSGTGVTMNANTVTANGNSGLYSENSSPAITGNTASGNINYGIYVTGAAVPATVTGNTLTGNILGPVGIAANSSATVVADSNTFTGPLYIDGGSLTKDTIWSNGRIYYIRGSITVNPGVTLTIPAGRVIKFAQDTGIFVSGTLSAIGASGAGQIYFTDYRDDTAGGDTNGDGIASLPGAAWWYGIHINNGGSATLDYSVIRYARGGSFDWPYYNSFAGVYKTGTGVLTLTNSTISNGGAYGVWITGSTATHTISNNTIQFNGSYGILLQSAGAGVTVSANTVTSNSSSGIYVENSSPAITGNTASGNINYGIYVTGAAVPATVTGNTLTGNILGPVGIAADSSATVVADSDTFTGPLYIDGGSLTKDTTWSNNRIYYIRGSITVNPGVTLTIPAGRVIKFAQDTGIFVSGTLSAIGASGTGQIYFTDYRDDTVGGDTNGDGVASSPGAAWWYGIHINNGGSATLDYSVIRYARGGSFDWPYYNSFAGVYKTGTGVLTLTNSTISNGGAYGVWITGSTATHTISNNAVQYNGSYGILLQNSGTGVTVNANTVTANGNSGLYSENSSPAITGNTASGNINYGIYVTGAAVPATVTGNTLTGNILGPVGIAADSSATVVADSNTFTGPLYIDGGSLTKDTTWSNSRIYYIRGSITVNTSMTLTIPAGRVIKFAQDTGIFVSGTLSAIGASGAGQIYFTDYRDDTAGGDTNGDGNAALPGAAWWYGIHINNGGSATLDYSVIRYARGGSFDWPYYNSFAGVYKTGTGVLSLTNSTIEYGSAYGVWITGSSAAHTISNNNIRNNGSYGLVLENAGVGVLIDSNTITGHSNTGIYLSGATATPNLFKNHIFANANGIKVIDPANPVIGGSADNGNEIYGNTDYGLYTNKTSPTVAASDNWWGSATGPYNAATNASGTGNKVSDNVAYTNYLSTGATLPVAGAVTTINGATYTQNTTWTLANSPYYISGNITINSGATLTIEPGVVVKFAQDTGIFVSGTLSAVGASGTGQVYFTDYRDDAIGGDTNGDGVASSPAAGWWYGIHINDGGSAALDHSVVRYARGGSFDNGSFAGIYKTGTGVLSLTNSTIEYGSAYGVWITGSSAAHIISNNNIRNNGSYGLVLENAGVGVLIDSNTITGHSDTGIYLSGAEATPNLFKNHIFANANGIKVIDPANPVIGSADNGNEIYGNTNYGLYTNRTSSAVTALYNWWGSSTGPYNAATNASGTGNKVSDNVAYTNYLSTGATLPVAGAVTTINGATYGTNTTWTYANSPYYISGSITINSGATLTIEPGVVVKFAQDTGIFVSGTLSAVGASASGQKIYFTDYRDDTAGGDTNGDGIASLPGAAWWYGIHINNGGSATLDYSVIRYARGGSFGWPYDNSFAGVYKTGTGVLSLTNSTIEYGSAYGVWITGSTATHTISNNTIQYNGSYGILLQNAGTGVTLNANTVTANGNSGLYIENSAPAISGNAASGNINYGIYVTGATVPSSIAGNTMTGNTIGPVGIAADSSGTVIAGDNTFTAPLYIDGGSLTKDTIWSNGRIYYIRGSITVNPGVILTIPAGRVIKFAQDTGIFVSGTLSAVGASASGQKIYFTDYRDDTAGGDTNGDGISSLPGAAWWHGIHINDGGSATLDYSVIRYARGGSFGWPYDNSFAGVYKTGTGVLSLTNSTIEYGSAYGVWITGSTATHTISNNTIQYNGSYGILLQNAGTGVTLNANTVTANGNSGLYIENSAPAISGNAASGNINYGIYVTGATVPSSIAGNTMTGNTIGPVGIAADSSGTVIAGDNTFTAPLYIDGGSLTKDTIWSNGRIYYIRGSITVNPGVILTIPAGRVIKFAQDTGIFVSGTLSAIGASGTGQIYFTDYRDDTAGGDTNGDGIASLPGAAWWYGIHINNGGSATLDYSVIRYARGGSFGWPYDNSFAGVYKTGTGVLSLTNSTIEYGSAYGVWITGSTATHTISNNTIQYNGSYGILLQNAGTGVTLNANTVTANGNSGLYIENSAPAISGNAASGNINYGIYVTGATVPSSIAGNTMTGNTIGPVGIAADSSGTVIAGDNTFTAPLYIDGGSLTKDTIWSNGRIYYIRGSITVNPGVTLTIPAGRVIKFAQDTGIFVSGTLSAVGASGTGQIYFTDYRDDTAGGDTNGDGIASLPGAAWWYGIHINNGGSATLDYSVIRYARGGSFGWPYDNSFAGVYKTGTGVLSLTNSTIEYGSAYGVWITGSTATHTISNNTIQYNGSYGILLQNAGTGVTLNANTVTANGNSGLYIENSAPAISGNAASGNINYGIYVTGATVPSSIAGNTMTGNTIGPVGIAADSSGTVIAGDNTFTAPLYIDGGSLTKDTIWSNGRIYYIRGSITVNPGVTLTIPAGRVIKFAQDTGIFVSGTLSAVGASGTGQIYFTDYRDDTAGGDTNGDGIASLPGAAWWYGIHINNGGSATLDYSVIRYARGGSFGWPYDNSFAGVYKTGTGVLSLTNSTIEYGSAYGVWITGSSDSHTISNNTIQYNGSYGIRLDSASGNVTITNNEISGNANGMYIVNSSPLIQDNTIRFNSGYGINLYGTATNPGIYGNRIYGNGTGIYSVSGANPVIGGSLSNGNDIYGNVGNGLQNDDPSVNINARYNWWGSPSGPYDPAGNATGTGNRVSAYVDYGNFFGLSTLIQAPHTNTDPPSHNFGGVKIGSVSEASTFTIKNDGTLDLTISGITLTGTDSSQFNIINDNCSSRTLISFASCTVQSAFLPVSGGTKTANLVIPSNDPATATPAIVLTGKGIDCTPPPSGITAWWPAEGNADDLVGFNPGVLNGNVTFVAGKVGQAFHFDGMNAFISVPDSPSLDAVNGDITVEGWIRLDSLPGAGDEASIISKGGGWNRAGWLLTVMSNGNVRWHLGNGSGEAYTDNGALTTGVWYHVAATLESGVMKTYINGVLQANTATGDHVYPNDYPLFLGKTDGGAPFFFKGDLDEWSLYNRALTAEEIATINDSGYTGKCTAGQVNLTVGMAGPTTALPDGSASYTATITNHGPDVARNVVLTDTLPPGTVTSVTASQGNCTVTGGNISCQLGDLARGATANVTINLRMPSHSIAIVNTVHLTVDGRELTLADNQATIETTVPSTAGDFETDPAGTENSVISFWDVDFYTHNDGGTRGTSPRSDHQLQISDTRRFSGAKSVYSFLRNIGGGGRGDADGRHSTQELYTEPGYKAMTAVSTLYIWRSDVAFTDPTSRWAWSFSVELADGIHTQDVLLACQCWGNNEGCSGNFFDNHDRTALGADGQTWYRHPIAIPPEMDKSNLKLRIRHTQDSWDGTTMGSGLYYDTIGPFDIYRLGDLNGDGSVTLADAILALQVASGMAPAIPNGAEAGDINGDHRIAMEEIIFIFQQISGLRP